MTRRLDWRNAGRRDRAVLQAFTCTVPSQRSPHRGTWHPKPWELEVQSFLRGLRPPLSPEQSLLLGEDSAGVAAIFLEAQQANPGITKLQALAVSVRHRGTGGGLADEAMDVVLETAAGRGRAASLDTVTVVSLIDRQNHASKQLHERTGFKSRGTATEDLEIWAMSFDAEAR